MAAPYNISIAAIILAGCGGTSKIGLNGAGEAGPTSAIRAEVRDGAVYALRLLDQHGDVEFGLRAKSPPPTSLPANPYFDAQRGLWARSTAVSTSPEAPDGASSLFQLTIDTDWYLDEATTQAAGHRKYFNEQNDFTHIETTKVDESITGGRFTGYTYTKVALMELGSSEVDATTIAKNASWGVMQSTSPKSGFNVKMTKGTLVQTYVQSADGEPVTTTLANGWKIFLDPSSMEGVAISADEKTSEHIGWDENGQGNIKWSDGSSTNFTIWKT